MFGLVDGGFKLNRGGVFSFEETGPDLLHQGFERSRCFKVQRPGTAEIRIVWLIRLGRGGSLGQAEHTEAHEGGEPAEQEVPHQSGIFSINLIRPDLIQEVVVLPAGQQCDGL